MRVSQESMAVGNSSISVQVSFGVGSSTTCGVVVRAGGVALAVNVPKDW